MINKRNAKDFCSEDISLIENYQEAVADKTQTWICHHRLECVDGIYTSPVMLKERGLYWKRPANELIFLTRSEHSKIHENDPVKKKKKSEAHLGKTHSKETKEKIRATLIGTKRSEETKRKLSKLRKGRRWWNNSLINKFCKEQPGPDFVRGRLRIQ